MSIAKREGNQANGRNVLLLVTKCTGNRQTYISKDIAIYKDVDEPINFYNQGQIIYEGIGLIDYIFIPCFI